MKAVWLTDIHINFLTLRQREEFYAMLRDTKADAIFITGDIGEALNVHLYLEALRNVLTKNQHVYFVAGNHDYYRGSVKEMREVFSRVGVGNLHYLTTAAARQLHDDVYICGVDGWADGRYGNYDASPVVLNDSYLIKELYESGYNERPAALYESGYVTKGVAKPDRKVKLLAKMQEFAAIDADLLKDQLQAVVSAGAKTIIVLTHVPPYPEVSLYDNAISDDNYLPFYTSRATGDVIYDFAEKYKQTSFKVFCGHSHHKALYEPLPNLTVKCGDAKYYEPIIAEEFVI